MREKALHVSNILIKTLVHEINRGDIAFPFYQRKYSWIGKRSYFEEKLIRFIFEQECLPSMIVLDRPLASDIRYVLDGGHRLRCLQRFINGDFKVDGITPQDIRGTSLTVTTARFDNDKDRLDFFSSLNTTSTKMATRFVEFVTNSLTNNHPTYPVIEVIKEIGKNPSFKLNTNQEFTNDYVLYQNLCQFLCSYATGYVKDNNNYTLSFSSSKEEAVYRMPLWVYKAVPKNVLLLAAEYLLTFQSPEYIRDIKKSLGSCPPKGKYLAFLLGKVFYEICQQTNEYDRFNSDTVLYRLKQKAAAKTNFKVEGANQINRLLKMVWE
jgi:hypothetical protein